MIKLSMVHPHAKFPTRGSPGAAGYDLYSVEEKIIHANDRQIFDTGISTEFSDDFVGIIKPRSGLAYRHGIDVLAGVIDSDFRDTIKVILINHGGFSVSFNAGDRIAQILFIPVAHCVIEHSGPVSETERGTGGFGSTGI